MPNLIQGQGQDAPVAARATQAPPPSRKTQTTADYGVLKAREKELNNQLQEVQERRDDLARQAEQSSGSTKTGLQSRVAVLDERLSNIEGDLSLVGRQLAEAAPASIVEPPVRII